MSEPLTLVIAVDDKGTPVLKSFSGAVGDAAEKMKHHGGGAAEQLSSRFKGLEISGSAVTKMLGALAAGVAAIGLGRLIGETIDISGKMGGLRAAFTAATGSVAEGKEQFKFAEEQSKRLGLEITGTAGAYKNLLAATLESGRSATTAQTIFKGFAEATNALGLSGEDTNAVMQALGQVMSKGSASAEELKGQIGERLPIVMGVLSQATGKSVAELQKMMEQGQLTADVLVPAAELMSKKYGTLAEDTDKPAKAFTLLTNAAKFLGEQLGNAGLDAAATMVAKSLASLVEQAQQSGVIEQLGAAARSVGEQFSQLAAEYGPAVIKFFADMVSFIAENVRPAIDTLAMGWQLFQTAANLAIAGTLNLIGGLMEALENVFGAFAKAAEWLGLPGVASALTGVKDAINSVRTEVDLMRDAATENASKSLDGFNALKNKTVETKDATGELKKANEEQGAAAKQAAEEAAAAKEKERQATEAAKKAADELAAAYKVLGIVSKEELVKGAQAALFAFQTVSASGKESASTLLFAWVDVSKKMTAAYGGMSEEGKRQSRELAQTAVTEFLKIRASGSETPEQIKERFNQLKAALQALGLWDIFKIQFAGIESDAENTANNIGDKFKDAGKKIEEGVAEGAENAGKKLKELDALITTVFEHKFGSTVTELMADLRQQANEAGKAFQTAAGNSDYGRSLLEAATKAQSILVEKLLAAGVAWEKLRPMLVGLSTSQLGLLSDLAAGRSSSLGGGGSTSSGSDFSSLSSAVRSGGGGQPSISRSSTPARIATTQLSSAGRGMTPSRNEPSVSIPGPNTSSTGSTLGAFGLPGTGASRTLGGSLTQPSLNSRGPTIRGPGSGGAINDRGPTLTGPGSGGSLNSRGPTLTGPTLRFARGGLVRRPTMGLLGEAGAEAVVPWERMERLLMQRMGESAGKQVVINAPITIQADLKNIDAKKVVQHLATEIKAAQRRGELTV
jgi:tape measure domain-containing protein